MRMARPRRSAPVRALAATTAALASALLVELELQAVDQGLPARLDDVRRDTDGAPVLVLVARLDQHPDQASRALGAAEDADLVVVEADLGDLRVELADRLPQRLVEGVHRAVALRRRVLDLPVRPLEHDRGLRERRLALGSLLVDDAEADQAEVAHAVAV